MALTKQQRQAIAVSLAIHDRQEREDAKMVRHPGFERAKRSIAKRTNPRTGQPYGEKRAAAILAAGARNASEKAKAANPRLRKVPGA